MKRGKPNMRCRKAQALEEEQHNFQVVFVITVNSITTIISAYKAGNLFDVNAAICFGIN